MKEIFLPNGYKCKIEKNQIFTFYNSDGYFIMNGFPHNFLNGLVEYGDNSGRKWNSNGVPLTENTPSDHGYHFLNKLFFNTVKEKVEIRKRVLEAYNKIFNTGVE